MVISIVIDCDRGHCYEHFKIKNQIPMKIEPVTYIWILMNLELPEDQKVKLWTFQAQPASVRVISSIFFYVKVVLE